MERYSKSILLEILGNREAEIKFKKIDGTIRVIRGTLNNEFIPPEYRTQVESKKVEHSEIVTIFDLDVVGWRSFRIDRVIEVL